MYKMADLCVDAICMMKSLKTYGVCTQHMENTYVLSSEVKNMNFAIKILFLFAHSFFY